MDGISDNNNVDSAMKAAFLKQFFGLVTLPYSAVTVWMRKLGFKYATQAKGYDVDGHEKPPTLKYRKMFTTEYLQMDLCWYRWI